MKNWSKSQIVSQLKSYKMPEMVIDEIINSSKIVNVKSHKKVLEYNEVSENAYVILSGGFVSVMKNKATNEEVAVNFFIPDYQPYMTSYDSFNYSIPSNCALKSFTNSNILIIPKSKVFEIKDKSEEFMKLYYQISIDGLLERNRIRTYFQNMTSEERFTHLQQEYPQVIREVPSKYIADYIGISPQWLSKLKRVKL